MENSENLISVGNTITACSVFDDELALLDTMKVVELRQELEPRGVSKNGLKKVLIERLKEAIRNRVGLLSNRPDVEVANIAGEGFSPGSYWKLIEPDESDEVDKSVMHIDEIHFRAPTTTVEEHNSNFNNDQKREITKKISIGYHS